MSRTFSIIKPDATNRNITGAINKIIEDNDLRVIGQKKLSYQKIRLRVFTLSIKTSLF